MTFSYLNIGPQSGARTKTESHLKIEHLLKRSLELLKFLTKERSIIEFFIQLFSFSNVQELFEFY